MELAPNHPPVPKEGKHKGVIIQVEPKHGKGGTPYSCLHILLKQDLAVNTPKFVVYMYVPHTQRGFERMERVLEAVFTPEQINQLSDRINQPYEQIHNVLLLTWGEQLEVDVKNETSTFGGMTRIFSTPIPIPLSGHDLMAAVREYERRNKREE